MMSIGKARGKVSSPTISDRFIGLDALATRATIKQVRGDGRGWECLRVKNTPRNFQYPCGKQMRPLALFGVLITSFALLACQPQASERAVELQKEAASTLAKAIANSNRDAISKALNLVNESLDISPNHVPSLVTLANINVYERRYEKALKDIDSAREIKPKDRSLHMLQCLLKERNQGKKSATPCYVALEKTLANKHQEGGPIDINWVAAAFLANSGNRQDLKHRYLQQKKVKPGYQLAKDAIQSFESQRYLQQIMP